MQSDFYRQYEIIKTTNKFSNMYLFLTILAVVASIILVLIVLVQNSKGGGLASSF